MRNEYDILKLYSDSVKGPKEVSSYVTSIKRDPKKKGGENI